MRIHSTSTKQGERGFSYIMLMIAIVVMGVAMSVAARQWKVMVQREQEADLLAKGIEIQNALALYSATKKAGRVMPGEVYPQTLAELTKQPKPFLRKVYLDPVGRAEWDLLRAPTGGIMGVRSKSRSKPIKQRAFPLVVRHFEGKPTYYDWVFQFPNTSMPTLVAPGTRPPVGAPGQPAAPGGSSPSNPLPPTDMTPPPVSAPLPTASS
ncbi:MAG: type II secretion system protein [Nitrospira sp.]|nr:type II secretion system protein [Nitrospira sp.]MBH0180636.1 type II secretion system protein [Nitrospira sp.]